MKTLGYPGDFVAHAMWSSTPEFWLWLPGKTKAKTKEPYNVFARKRLADFLPKEERIKLRKHMARVIRHDLGTEAYGRSPPFSDWVRKVLERIKPSALRTVEGLYENDLEKRRALRAIAAHVDAKLRKKYNVGKNCRFDEMWFHRLAKDLR